MHKPKLQEAFAQWINFKLHPKTRIDAKPVETEVSSERTDTGHDDDKQLSIDQQYHQNMRKSTIENLYSTAQREQIDQYQKQFEHDYPMINTMQSVIDKTSTNSGEIVIGLQNVTSGNEPEQQYQKQLIQYFQIINSWQRGSVLYQPLRDAFEHTSTKIVEHQGTREQKTPWVMRKALPKLLKQINTIVESQYAEDNYAIKGYRKRYTKMMKTTPNDLMETMFTMGVNQYLVDTLFPNLEFLHADGIFHQEHLVDALFEQFNHQPTSINLLSLLASLQWVTRERYKLFNDNPSTYVPGWKVIRNLRNVNDFGFNKDQLQTYLHHRIVFVDDFRDNHTFKSKYNSLLNNDCHPYNGRTYKFNMQTIYHDLIKECILLTEMVLIKKDIVKSTVYVELEKDGDLNDH